MIPKLLGNQVFVALVRRDGTRLSVTWESPTHTSWLVLQLMDILQAQDPVVAKALLDHIKTTFEVAP